VSDLRIDRDRDDLPLSGISNDPIDAGHFQQQPPIIATLHALDQPRYRQTGSTWTDHWRSLDTWHYSRLTPLYEEVVFDFANRAATSIGVPPLHLRREFKYKDEASGGRLLKLKGSLGIDTETP
jgi:hypothetical protein